MRKDNRFSSSKLCSPIREISAKLKAVPLFLTFLSTMVSIGVDSSRKNLRLRPHILLLLHHWHVLLSPWTCLNSWILSKIYTESKSFSSILRKHMPKKCGHLVMVSQFQNPLKTDFKDAKTFSQITLNLPNKSTPLLLTIWKTNFCIKLMRGLHLTFSPTDKVSANSNQNKRKTVWLMFFQMIALKKSMLRIKGCGDKIREIIKN